MEISNLLYADRLLPRIEAAIAELDAMPPHIRRRRVALIDELRRHRAELLKAKRSKALGEWD